MRVESLLTVLLACEMVAGYWDPERQNVENPRNDQSNCDEYCKLLLPSYINWREHVSGIEYNGLDVVLRDTDSGFIKGLSVPGVHDTNSFVSMFLGIPYAKPPVHEDAFKVGHPSLALPVPHQLLSHLFVANITRIIFLSCTFRYKPAQEHDSPWDDVRDCTYYRPACPQVNDFISEDIPGFDYINEDCLHLNVFQPNVSVTLEGVSAFGLITHQERMFTTL